MVAEEASNLASIVAVVYMKGLVPSSRFGGSTNKASVVLIGQHTIVLLQGDAVLPLEHIILSDPWAQFPLVFPACLSSFFWIGFAANSGLILQAPLTPGHLSRWIAAVVIELV